MTSPKQTIQARTIAQWLLVAIAFLLPWQTRLILLPGTLQHDPWEYGTVSLYGLDILIILFILFAAGYHFMDREHFHWKPSHVFSLALASLTFLSLMYAGNKINGLFWAVKLIEGVLLLLVIPGLGIKHKMIAWALIAAGAIQGMLAYVQFSMQEVIANKWLGMAAQLPATLGVVVVDGPLGRVLRSYGSFPHPNMLGGFLVIAALAAIFIYLHSNTIGDRLLSASALPLIGTGIWLSFSRQAWVALAVCIVILVTVGFLTTKAFPARLMLGLTYLLLPIITLTLLFPSLVGTRTAASGALEERSLNERSMQIQEASGLLQDNWIIGVGMGNYTAQLHTNDKEADTLRPGYAYQPVHNIYLLMFTELGLASLLLFAGLIGSLLYRAAFESQWSLAWGLGVLSLLVIGFFDHYLWSLHIGIILFWFVIGLYEDKRKAID